MTATLTAATRIRDSYDQLADHDRDALISDDGLTVDVDGVEVAVWHRDDDVIVAFTSPDGVAEEWTEIDRVSYRLVTTDADSIFLHAGDGSQPDGRYTWHEIVATAREWGTIMDADPIAGTVTVRTDDVDGVSITALDAHL